MKDYMIYFGVIESGLLIIPVIAYLVYKKRLINKRYTLYFCLFFGLLSIGRLFNLTFYGDLSDYILPTGIYFGYCLLIFYSLKIKNKLLKFSTFILGLIPVGLGFIAATFGIFGIMMLSGGIGTTKSVAINDKIYFREYVLGDPTEADGGKTIKIYKPITFLPFIEKEILSEDMSYPRYDIDSINIKLSETDKQYSVRIFSRDKLQVDTLLKR